MRKLFDKLSIYTDFYELILAQAYFLQKKGDTPAAFDYFFRSNPYEGGYLIFAGLDNLLDILENFQYDTDTLRYLREQGLHEGFLEFLANFRFRGTISAPREGEVVFPTAPILRVEGTIIETQLVETLLLNLLNFQSLIATKAARIRQAAGNRLFIDFGLRRAQGWSGMHAGRAAIIGGADASSNVLGGYYHGLPLWATMAHSWVQSFEDELTAFRNYVLIYPDNATLLVDTYNTLQSGVPNAITVAQELAAQGKQIAAIRLDSGDLAYLSKKARKMLDEAGFSNIKILVSNQLDEYLIRSLDLQKAPIDGYAVGTKLITAHGESALDGVYKMSMYNQEPTLKISNDYVKVSLPALKKVCRYYDAEGFFYRDGVLLLEEDKSTDIIYSPIFSNQSTKVAGLQSEELLHIVMQNGKRILEKQHIQDIARYAAQRLALLPEEHRRFENPHIYKVGLSRRLMDLRDSMLQRFSKS
ncbi:MAG: nicotinate phosphoribosyltransferase [Sphingobacteriales bacterium]|nr:nicotinate phosphoribosyltransferase [Sphingobacteriales bacterium]